MKRQSRDKRRPGVSIRLNARDTALLRSVNRFRIARSRDLGRLFFAGRHRDVVAQRLRKLYDTAHLETHVLDRAGENVYSLGPRGQAYIPSLGGKVGGVPRRPWEHHLGIVSIWSGIAAAVHQLPGVRLIRVRPDWEAREGARDSLAVIPDALVEIAWLADGQDRRVRLAIELDRGTESLEVLRRKIRVLADLRDAGRGFLDWTSFDLVLALDGAGRNRESRVRELLVEEWAGSTRVWTPTTDLAAELQQFIGGLEPPVAASLCGNGRTGGLSRVVTESSLITGGRPSEDQQKVTDGD